MATVNKDFKIKSGLVVEGTTGTINGYDILTESQGSIDFIVSTIGGTATAVNTPNTVVKRDADGNFAAGDITVNELSISEIGRIYEDGDGDLVIANVDNKDVEINASDLRLNATDDIRLEADDFVGITSLNGIIEFHAPDGNVFINGDAPEDKIVVRGTLNDIIGDGTVDGTSGNTVTDRIASASQDLTDHENATEAHGATGAVVGTTNEQTLINKTISYTDNTLTVQVANVSDLTANASELNVLDGITASTSELNILDGVTADYTELNVLDGITATTTELNYVDGVTSGIQGQLDDKAPLDAPALTGIPTAPTAAAGTNNTQIATTAYADAAVAALVDAAPAMLDTLNELAAALGDDEDFIGTVNAAIGEKVAKAGDTMTGLLVLSADPSANLGAATKQYVDTAESDAVTSANSYTDGRETAITTAYEAYADIAEVDAKAYADGLDDATNTRIDELTTSDVAEGTNLYFTNQRAIDAVGGTIEDQIDLLDTDDIEEGATNLYFTDSRAKTSAADLLTGANLINITITGTGAGLTITAENGVADSTTTDLTEGTNLYFTDERALSAINGENIQPESIDITWVRREEATWTDVPTASKATCHSAGTNEGSMKYLVRVTASVGGTRHSHVTEVLATVDGSNGVAVVEYGTIYTSTEPLATVTVEWNASTSKYDLNVTTANNSSEVMVAATLMATLD
jgi:hypothetical protein